MTRHSASSSRLRW